MVVRATVVGTYRDLEESRAAATKPRMIPASPTPRQPPRWQRELQQAITDPAELLSALGLGVEWLEPARAAARLFPLKVPRGFVARMRRGDPRDPLLLQVLPLAAELSSPPGYLLDPVGDLASRAGAGVLRKYHGRALLITTGACAVNCRYCFRRHFPYAEENASRADFGPALEVLRADASIREVILSGGDPLTLGDRRLATLLEGLEAIPHLRRVRLHTRLPIVLPERIDAGFLATWSAVRLQKVAVVHANHAAEIDASVRDALASLKGTGTTLLNQAVLLRGVNDRTDDLVALSEALFEAGALPYYLHLLDPVAGAAHFDVPEERARTLVAEVAARLPGYLVPRLVREIAGEAAKTMLPPASR
jgi:EF-P beta-lysylation protein EpmB